MAKNTIYELVTRKFPWQAIFGPGEDEELDGGEFLDRYLSFYGSEIGHELFQHHDPKCYMNDDAICEELQPCPHCNNPPVLAEYKETFVVFCIKCADLSRPFDRKDTTNPYVYRYKTEDQATSTSIKKEWAIFTETKNNGNCPLIFRPNPEEEARVAAYRAKEAAGLAQLEKYKINRSGEKKNPEPT